MKRELSQKTRLSVCQWIFIPTFTSGHKQWTVTERMRLQIQYVTEMLPPEVIGILPQKEGEKRHHSGRTPSGVDDLRGCLGIWFGCLHDTTLEDIRRRYSRHVQPVESPEHTGNIVSRLAWEHLRLKLIDIRM